MRTLSRPRSARKNSAPRPRATARVATPAKPLTVAAAERQLERAHEEYKAARASTDEAMVTLWEKRQDAEDALRRAKGLPTFAEENKAKREAEERAKAEAAKGRPIDLRHIGSMVHHIRDGIADVGAYLSATELGLVAGGMYTPPGPDATMLEHGQEGVRLIRLCLGRLALVTEYIASEIGQAVEPDQASCSLDAVTFDEKRSGVVYGEQTEGGAA